MRTPLVSSLFAACSLAAAATAQSAPCTGGQAFDDGTAERFVPDFYLGPGDVYFVSLFTPPTLPYVYDHVCMQLNGYTGIESFDVIVFDDDGIGGDPSMTILRQIPVTHDLTSTPQWIECDLDCLEVYSGSVWIGIHMRNGVPGPDIGVDTGGNHPYRWTARDSVPGPWGWASDYFGLQPAALMIRAVGAPPAEATIRRGSGVNPQCYLASAPHVGSTWKPRVLHGASALQTRVYFYALPSAGTLSPYGEVLVDLTSPRFFTSVLSSSGSADTHVFAIPPDSALIGVEAATQALVIEPGNWTLCNAIDVRIGC